MSVPAQLGIPPTLRSLHVQLAYRGDFLFVSPFVLVITRNTHTHYLSRSRCCSFDFALHSDLVESLRTSCPNLSHLNILTCNVSRLDLTHWLVPALLRLPQLQSLELESREIEPLVPLAHVITNLVLSGPVPDRLADEVPLLKLFSRLTHVTCTDFDLFIYFQAHPRELNRYISA